ncbi:MAG: phenylalanine--tRNA ligase subunit alpha [Bacteroidales bacterium]
MHNKIKDILSKAREFKASDLDELEEFRVKFLGKKGIIPGLFNEFKTLPPSEKKDTGKLLNELKNFIQNKLEHSAQELSVASNAAPDMDLTLPANHITPGSRHPISMVRKEIIEIFSRIGFTISEGPEIEDDWHVFSALNFPEDHPARDMQDTFFISKDPDILLRTHTSPVQVRVMENGKPPIRTISPGRVFRNEAISARSHCIFHQIEGLYVDENVSFADLKQTLEYFARELFGEETKIRLRPSFFPFTEPSGEMDVSCSCMGAGCRLCKNTGWLEVLGCGMVDPNVLKDCSIDPVKFTGFAFGLGIERIALLKYDIKDIRLYFENDVRFLNQFSGVI